LTDRRAAAGSARLALTEKINLHESQPIQGTSRYFTREIREFHARDVVSARSDALPFASVIF
jgi:hypothetical protein